MSARSVTGRLPRLPQRAFAPLGPTARTVPTPRGARALRPRENRCRVNGPVHAEPTSPTRADSSSEAGYASCADLSHRIRWAIQSGDQGVGVRNGHALDHWVGGRPRCGRGRGRHCRFGWRRRRRLLSSTPSRLSASALHRRSSRAICGAGAGERRVYSFCVGKQIVDESRKCPMCGYTTWVLLDGHSTLQALEGGLEALAYSCEKCGFIRWHRRDKTATDVASKP